MSMWIIGVTAGARNRTTKRRTGCHFGLPTPWRCIDEIGFDRAHFIGTSWGGRLAFGIGHHVPNRVLSLAIGGQQPYAWPDSPLIRADTDGLAAAQVEGMEAIVQALEGF